MRRHGRTAGIEREPLREGVVAISLVGEADVDAAFAFKQALLAASRDGAEDLVVDLTRLTLIESTTVGVLVDVARRMHDSDVGLVVVCSDETLVKLFHITALDRLFPIVSSRNEALLQLSMRDRSSAVPA